MNLNLKIENNRYALTEEGFKNSVEKLLEVNNSKIIIYFFTTINNYNLKFNNLELKGVIEFMQTKTKIERLKRLNERIKNKQKYLGASSPFINEIYTDLLKRIIVLSKVEV